MKYVLAPTSWPDCSKAIRGSYQALLVSGRAASECRSSCSRKIAVGVEKSARREANRARLERFAAGVRVLPFDLALATRYATVRADLERKGRPKTDFDLVVACTALEHGATLITNDGGLKAGAIDGLMVADWLDLVT